MGSPSINLNSLLSAMGSGSTGIDVASTVAQLVAAKRVPELQWQQQIQDLQTQSSLLTQFNAAVSDLSGKLNALQDPVGALTAMKTTSSNTDLVSASAIPGTAAGSHVVIVDHLASTGSWYSDSVANGSTTLAPGNFTLQVGTGPATQITIGSGVDTLDQLASYINSQNLGVNASVVNDAIGSRLAIVSKTSGAAGDISISAASGLSFTQAVQGTNASLTVDGIPISSASNSVSGAVNGLTLNLLGASPATEVSVTIANDSSAASQAVRDFVTAYNTLINGVNAQFKFDSNGQTSGPLASDQTMRMLQDILLGSGSYAATGGDPDFSTLGMLGIAMNNDGTLTADDAKLNDAIQNHFSDVQNFFQGTASNGFASNLNSQLHNLTDSTQGAFAVDLKSISNQQADLQDQIDDFEVYITNEQKRLTDQYNQVDIMLQQLPIQLKQIQAALGNPDWGNTK